jgi:hypothetical protein
MNPIHMLSKIQSNLAEITDLTNQIRGIRDLILFQQTRELQASHANPLNKSGKKCFSQTDEDGITLEILRRLDTVNDGVYAEFGVGNGMENNSLILMALGWKGFWVGGEEIKPKISHGSRKFIHFKQWITLENIADTAQKGLAHIASEKIDVISLDLDGNDIYFAEALLSSIPRPKLFIVEYNAKFPPPVEFSIKYDPQHSWQRDDYFGASLSSFDKLFRKFNYRLVCCNSHTGANAFFVDAKYSDLFQDVPTDINALYVEPRYHLYAKYGHSASLKTIERIFENL